MKIDEMPAGREMDALIAEKVMGWRVHLRNTAWWVLAGLENESSCGPIKAMTCGSDRWSPSTDIVAAWKVLMKLQAMGYKWTLGSSRAKTIAILMRHDNKDGIISADTDTAPLAICRAALKALGVS